MKEYKEVKETLAIYHFWLILRKHSVKWNKILVFQGLGSRIFQSIGCLGGLAFSMHQECSWIIQEFNQEFFAMLPFHKSNFSLHYCCWAGCVFLSNANITHYLTVISPSVIILAKMFLTIPSGLLITHSIKIYKYIIHIMWRRPVFFRGGKPRPLKGYHSAVAGAQMATKFKILKQIQVLKIESIFQNFQHFLARKFDFSKKPFEKLNRVQKNFWVSGNYSKLSNFEFLWNFSNPDIFLRNAVIYIKKLSKPQENWLRSRR